MSAVTQSGFNNIYLNTTAFYAVGFIQNGGKFGAPPTNRATNADTIPLAFGCPLNVSTVSSINNPANGVQSAISSQTGGVVNAFTVPGSTAEFDSSIPNSTAAYKVNIEMLVALVGSGIELILPIDSTITGSLTKTLYITPFVPASGTGGVVTTTVGTNLVLPASVKLIEVLGTNNYGYAPILQGGVVVGYSLSAGVSVAKFVI